MVIDLLHCSLCTLLQRSAEGGIQVKKKRREGVKCFTQSVWREKKTKDHKRAGLVGESGAFWKNPKADTVVRAAMQRPTVRPLRSCPPIDAIMNQSMTPRLATDSLLAGCCLLGAFLRDPPHRWRHVPGFVAYPSVLVRKTTWICVALSSCRSLNRIDAYIF